VRVGDEFRALENRPEELTDRIDGLSDRARARIQHHCAGVHHRRIQARSWAVHRSNRRVSTGSRGTAFASAR